MANRFISEDYFEIIIPNVLLKEIQQGALVTNINDKYSIVSFPSKMINKCELDSLNYSYLPSCYTLESSLALEDTGVTKVQNNQNLALFGTGVLIGIVDSGINYLHPAFLYHDNTSRIYSIWDQTINPQDRETVDTEFPYGTIYTKEEINKALNEAYPLEFVPTTDEVGHGTMVAGISGGTVDKANNFAGVAPLSEFVIVKLKPAKNIVKEYMAISQDKLCYLESDVMMGVKYLEKVATQLNRPLALCVAMGSNQGSHDGYGALSSYLNSLSTLPKTCVVVSAGNEGNTRRHYASRITKVDEYKEFELIVGENDKQFFMEIWTQPLQRFTLQITSPTGEKISNLYPSFHQTTRHNFVFGPTIICVNNITTEPESGDQLIWLRFENMQSGIWKFRVYNVDKTNSTFNVWLPSGNIISKNTYFMQPDPYTTITSPGNGIATITVTSYNTEEGGISEFSSKGYSRTNEIKPDIAAPGNNLKAPTTKNGYATATGTGAATAISTGIVALLLEWASVRGNYTGITGIELKTFLLRGAKRDLYIDYPNRTWGYGKIDLYGVFEKLIV